MKQSADFSKLRAMSTTELDLGAPAAPPLVSPALSRCCVTQPAHTIAHGCLGPRQLSMRSRQHGYPCRQSPRNAHTVSTLPNPEVTDVRRFHPNPSDHTSRNHTA